MTLLDDNDKLWHQLSLLKQRNTESQNFSIGTPKNFAVSYGILSDFMGFSFNNIGDPFIDLKRGFSTRKFERQVLSFFADLYNLPSKKFWGYISSCGTEGSMYGLWLGRERYPNGILYYSQASHYSIPKISRILRMQSVVVPALYNGELDYGAFELVVQAQKDKPVILNMNIGTTMQGAIDDINKVLDILHKNQIKQYHIHCDAALFGAMLPFIANAPQIDFRQPIATVSVSGHKFFGLPMPCGIVLTRQEHINVLENNLEYLSTLDTTIGGSRNGHTSLILWYVINTKKIAELRRDVQLCLQNAHYLYEKLREIDYPCFLNPHSNVVSLKRPPLALSERWRLLTQADSACVTVMPHVTKDRLNQFLEELKEALLAKD